MVALSGIAGQLEGLAEELLNQSRPIDKGGRDGLLQLFSSIKAASADNSGISITDAAA